MKAVSVPSRLLKVAYAIFCFSAMDIWMANPEHFQGN
jgi:hypothetical protein